MLTFRMIGSSKIAPTVDHFMEKRPLDCSQNVVLVQLRHWIYEQILLGYKLAAQRKLSNTENAIIGAFAGAITGAITTPLDVIKTRLMVQGSANRYKGICDCVRTIAREEGMPTLFNGMGPRVLWIGIKGSIFFGVLEMTKEARHGQATDSHILAERVRREKKISERMKYLHIF